MALGRELMTAIGAAALSAVGLWFATGLHPVWWLTWVAIVPVLLAARNCRPWVALVAAILAWAGGGLNMWRYLHADIGIPVLPSLQAVVAPALLFGLAVMLWRTLVRCGAAVRATLLMACFWTAFDYLNMRTSPHGTFGSLAYSQADCLPVIQLASLTGLAGITFLLFLVPAAVATLRRAPIAMAAALLACVAGWGTLRLRSIPVSPMVEVGLASTDVRADLFPSDDTRIRQLMTGYAESVRAMVASGARVVLLPEKLAKVQRPETVAEIDRIIRDAAGPADVAIGLERWTPEAKRNEIRLYRAGTLEALYEKHHMLPPFESHLLVGVDRTVVDRPTGKWGMTICKDMDFPQLSRDYGNDGVGLLLVPAWDFVSDGWLHGRMAILRGVESGFTIVRAAKQGLLTVSDDRGRVLAERETGALPFVTLIASAPVRHTATLYARWGDWFAWLSIAGLLAGVAIPWGRRAVT